MGFFVQGSQDDRAVTGNLVAENATDRVETPFTGTRSDEAVTVEFDTTHENEGEQVRLIGTFTATVVE